MAKIYKFSGYTIDVDDIYGKGNIIVPIPEGNRLFTRHAHIEEADFEWDEQHLINDINCDLAICEQYFDSKPSGAEIERDIPKTGEIYQHFKGKLVKVLAVAQDTEHVGAFHVIYECLDEENKGKIWSRPLEMFLSPVDKEKYPDVEQEQRFKLV